MKGFKQLGLLVCTGIVGALIGVLTTMQMSPLSASKTTGHEHELITHTAVQATCTNDGHRTYWECPECNAYFSDEFGVYPITQAEFNDWVMIKKLNHQTNENYHIHEQKPTCATTGNQSYYICINGCGGYFEDENCTNEIEDKNSVILPKSTKHNGGVKYVEAKDATCTEAGNEEHYLCTCCHQTFADKYCTKAKPNVVRILEHETNEAHHVQYQAETCLSQGNIEYYDCIHCGQHFKDQQLSEVVEDVTIEKKACSSYQSHFVPAKNPTCEANGNIAYYICENGCERKYAEVTCEHLLTDEDINIQPLGHNHVLQKADANQIATYQKDENDENKYTHGTVDCQLVCQNCGHKLNNGAIIQKIAFAEIDRTLTRNSIVTDSIVYDEDTKEVYDLYEIDWSNVNGSIFKIKITLPDTYCERSKYSYNGVEVTDIQVNNYGIELIVHANQAEDLIWKFDWDGDNHYEQIIKVQINNYN